MSHPALVVLILAVGIAVAVQAAMNAKMGAALASPVGGALVNFLVGLVLLAALLTSGLLGRFRLAGLGEAPWWAYLGGAIGAAFVTISVIAVPRVGGRRHLRRGHRRPAPRRLDPRQPRLAGGAAGR